MTKKEHALGNITNEAVKVMVFRWRPNLLHNRVQRMVLLPFILCLGWTSAGEAGGRILP